jgi:hypothetical protein
MRARRASKVNGMTGTLAAKHSSSLPVAFAPAPDVVADENL